MLLLEVSRLFELAPRAHASRSPYPLNRLPRSSSEQNIGGMKARLVKFGEIEVEGKRYTHDVVIDGGKVRKRKKGPSKQFREKFGHTPLSAGEEIPWGGKRLMVGTGAHGALPVMDEVLAEAKRRGIEVIAASTSEVCQLLEEVKKGQAYAILHCTC